MVSYPFYIYDETDITAKLTMMNSKLGLDLELSALYDTYSYVDQLLSVEMTSALDEFQEEVLINIIDILFYGSIAGLDVYVVNADTFNRRSFSVGSAPGSEHHL